MTDATDFWSRRKARVREEQREEERLVEAKRLEAELAEREEKSDEDILAELDLPDPDTMKPGDDFSAFMKKAVPDRLRRRALRKLWLSNPALANLDGLIDYGEDFTDSAKVIENLQTTYQVGKGMLKHILALEEQAAAEEASENESDTEDSQDDSETLIDSDLPEANQLEADLSQSDLTLKEDTSPHSAGALAFQDEASLSETDAAPVEARPIRRMQFAYSQ